MVQPTCMHTVADCCQGLCLAEQPQQRRAPSCGAGAAGAAQGSKPS